MSNFTYLTDADLEAAAKNALSVGDLNTLNLIRKEQNNRVAKNPKNESVITEKEELLLG